MKKILFTMWEIHILQVQGVTLGKSRSNYHLSVSTSIVGFYTTTNQKKNSVFDTTANKKEV